MAQNYADRKISDIASYVARTEMLDDRDRLRVALELIYDSSISVRPEVTAYLKEAIKEAA